MRGKFVKLRLMNPPNKTTGLTIGMDLGDRRHAVCILSANGDIVTDGADRVRPQIVENPNHSAVPPTLSTISGPTPSAFLVKAEPISMVRMDNSSGGLAPPLGVCLTFGPDCRAGRGPLWSTLRARR